MKQISPILMTLTAFALPSQAGISLHGGSSVVCEGADGKTVRLTDLYRAEIVHALPLVDAQRSSKRLLKQALRRASSAEPAFGARLRDLSLEIQKRLFIAPSIQGLGAASTDDAGTLSLAPGCELAQLAVFWEGKLAVQKDLYLALSPLDQAALIVHEAAFVIQRTSAPSLSPVDSVSTQKLVGLLFARNFDSEETAAAIAALQKQLRPGSYGLSAANEISVEVAKARKNKIRLSLSNASPSALFHQEPWTGFFLNSENGLQIEVLSDREFLLRAEPTGTGCFPVGMYSKNR